MTTPGQIMGYIWLRHYNSTFYLNSQSQRYHKPDSYRVQQLLQPRTTTLDRILNGLKDPLSVWHAFQCYIIPTKRRFKVINKIILVQKIYKMFQSLLTTNISAQLSTNYSTLYIYPQIGCPQTIAPFLSLLTLYVFFLR